MNKKLTSRIEYNTRPLKIFSDDECKDFELSKNEIPVRYSDLITIKEFIGKRLELSDNELQMFTLKISLEYDGYGYEDLTFNCKIDGNIICCISISCHLYKLGDRIESINNKDIQNLLVENLVKLTDIMMQMMKNNNLMNLKCLNNYRYI